MVKIWDRDRIRFIVKVEGLRFFMEMGLGIDS